MTIHVVGAGLAGLAAAGTVARAGRGRRVVLYEATAGAGGRCRSWHDRRLDAEIDNGTHVVLGANAAVRAHLDALGSSGEVAWLTAGPSFHPAGGGPPWRAAGPAGVLAAHRAFGGPAAAELATALSLALPFGAATIGARLGRRSRLAAELWDPLARAVMNTPSASADADAFARVLRRTILRGPAAMRVGVARRSLARGFVDPALEQLRALGAERHHGARLRSIGWAGDRPVRLHFGDATIDLAGDDALILALPPWDLEGLVPAACIPAWQASPIVNLHVRVASPAAADGEPVLTGFAGRTADWALLRDGVASITTSAADALVDADPEMLARRLWADVAPALGLADQPFPARWRMVKERRATPRQTPGYAARRLVAAPPPGGILLAGDWTVPALPCTIETALTSGVNAAMRALAAANGR